MSSSHSYGEAKNAIKFLNNQIIFEEEQLSEIFLHPDVKDREVAIFAIVGSYRRGKSFFMDYCLRFMYANYRSINFLNNPLQYKDNWIGDAEEPLKGFSWRSGSSRDTTGISFWSDVFLYDSPNGDPLAVLLVDTQGLFDPETSTEENMKILSLGTLFSSTLILNLTNIIQEDQLQYLQFTTEYAKFIQTSSPQTDIKPFQKFLFLVRDWQNVDDYEFGFNGGQAYLNEVLKTNNDQNDDLRTVRDHIRESFDRLLCYLMPYPGKKVASYSDYDGRWSLMDEDFMKEIKNLIESFFKPQNMVVKKVEGVDLKAHKLFEYIKSYINLFSTPGSIPKPKSLHELAVGKFLTQIVTKCYEIYEQHLRNPSDRNEINLIHSFALSKALEAFTDAKKMGNAQDSEKFKKNLEQKIQKREFEWKNLMQIHFVQIEEEQRNAKEAADEIERIRKKEEELENKRNVEELQRQLEEHEREIARQQEELRLKNQQIKEELQRQKDAEESLRRERERQQQIEEERRRLEEEQRRRDEESRRLKIHIKELGINFHVPKPKCSVM
ncbi:hypothetical protein ACKWTF_016544 [Chironomus riparius]